MGKARRAHHPSAIELVRWWARRKSAFAHPTAAPDGQISRRDKILSSPISKNISLSPSGKSGLRARPVLSRQEGRIAIVTNAGRDAVDATASARSGNAGQGHPVSGQPARRTNGAATGFANVLADVHGPQNLLAKALRGRQNRVVLAPVAGVKLTEERRPNRV